MAVTPLSSRAQKLLRLAHGEAESVGSADIASEHLLLGALALGGYLTSALCSKSSLSLQALRHSLGSGVPKVSGCRYSESAETIFRAAVAISRSLRHKRVDAAHIVLALLGEKEGEASRALDLFNVRRQGAQSQIRRRLRKRKRPL